MPTPASQGRPDAEVGQVLVVDDDEDLRHALNYLLRDAGYAVFEAPNGSLALKQLRASRRGMVVLLDVHMPEVDGIEMMYAVAAQDHLARRHAYILMTADWEWLPPVFLALLEELRVPVLAKPFDILRTLDIVSQAEERLKANA